MRHPREEWLALAATHDLGWWQAGRVARHLAVCPRCAAASRKYAELAGEFGGLPAPETPAGLERIILARAGEQAAVSGQRSAMSWAAVGAVAVLAVALVWVTPSGVRSVKTVESRRDAGGPRAEIIPPQPAPQETSLPLQRPVPKDLMAAEAERDRRYLGSLHGTNKVVTALERWEQDAAQQSKNAPRLMGGQRAEVLRSHALPAPVEIVSMPGSPLELVSAGVSISEGRLIDPVVEVRNTSSRPVRSFQVVWVFKNAAGAEFRGRISSRAASLKTGGRLQLAENMVFETEGEIVAARVFLRAAEFADNRVWVPERNALEARNVGQFLPLSKAGNELLLAYRQRGAQAVTAELKK